MTPKSQPNSRGSLRLPAPAIIPTAEAMLHCFEQSLTFDVANGDAADDTLVTYRRRVNQFLNWCASVELNPAFASSDEIKAFRHFLIKDRQHKPKTIGLTLTVVRRFYHCACDQGLIKENPAVGIKPPREKIDPAEQITYLESEELKQLLNIIPRDGSLKSKRDRALVAIMALQGPRTVEIHRASFEDLQRTRSSWGLRVEGKGSIRMIPLRPDLAEILWQYLEARERSGEVLEKDSPLFISLNYRSIGQRLSRRGIRYVVDGYLQQVGLKHIDGRKISAHSLRHTAGTLGLRGGADLRQVQDLLGHKDPKTTAIYAHVNDRHANNPALGIDVEL
ncbi:MAG: tyrosine-type recombinase/integrase [Cyanobacteria bacterium J06592_8]